MMKTILNRMTLANIMCLGYVAVIASVQEARASKGDIQLIIQSYCIDCHNDSEQNAEINLKPFLQGEAAVDRELLISVYDQINLEQMPPKDEIQPTGAERAKMLRFLNKSLQASGSSAIDKKLLPGYGNYVDHEALFEIELIDPQPAPAPRIWRYSPESYSERVNRIAGQDVIKFVPVATFPVPQTGLKHPAFPYKGPAHTAKDYANIHDFGLTETELLIGLAEELSEAQFNSGTLKEYRDLPPGDDGSLIPAERITVAFYPQVDRIDAKTHPRPGKAEVNVADGTFNQVTSHEHGDGVVLGKQKVTIAALDSQGRVTTAIPLLYAHPKRTPLEVDSADSPYLFEIKKPR